MPEASCRCLAKQRPTARAFYLRVLREFSGKREILASGPQEKNFQYRSMCTKGACSPIGPFFTTGSEDRGDFKKPLRGQERKEEKQPQGRKARNTNALDCACVFVFRELRDLKGLSPQDC